MDVAKFEGAAPPLPVDLAPLDWDGEGVPLLVSKRACTGLRPVGAKEGTQGQQRVQS